MREYIEPLYGWDIDEQRRLHVRYFKPQPLSIIEDDNGAAIGLLDVSDKGDHLYVSRIEVRPEAQGRGVGTAIMDGLIREGRTIRLRVFKNNVRARRFYERLGFVVDHESDDEHHLSMHRAGEVT